MQRFKLISFDICPYVQRSVITLEHKQVPYELEYIDLSDKPDWFLEISPFGKVPVLIVGDAGAVDRSARNVLFESAVINEYLDEVTGGNRLMPSDPLERAHNRSWIEFSSALVTDVATWMLADDEGGVRNAVEAAHKKLERLDANMVGPFFNGEHLSLVDAAIAPALQRILWHETALGESPLRDLAKVSAWRDALLALPAVKRSTVSDVRDRDRAYIQRRAGWLASRI